MGGMWAITRCRPPAMSGLAIHSWAAVDRAVCRSPRSSHPDDGKAAFHTRNLRGGPAHSTGRPIKPLDRLLRICVFRVPHVVFQGQVRRQKASYLVVSEF